MLTHWEHLFQGKRFNKISFYIETRQFICKSNELVTYVYMLRVYTERYFRKDYNPTLLLHKLFTFNFKGIFEKQGKKQKYIY